MSKKEERLYLRVSNDQLEKVDFFVKKFLKKTKRVDFFEYSIKLFERLTELAEKHSNGSLESILSEIEEIYKHLKKTITINKKQDNIYSLKIEKEIEIPYYTAGVSAGSPLEAHDDHESLDLNQYLTTDPQKTFIVKVTGDSMIDAGIYSGDLLIVDQSKEARNHNIIVALLDGEFTTKRLIKEKGKVFLVPENEEYQKIEVKAHHEFKIWGVVTGMVRDSQHI